jgi:Pentapeptide repeats (8 copies)
MDMAHQEHLDLLKQGSTAWNAWRVQHKEVRPDLSELDLREANLREADLHEADLSDVDLSKADLSRTNLNGAHLSGADLSGANLREAYLIQADLSGANLSDTNLRWANLHFANLSKANLQQADLSEATLSYANLNGANLNRTILVGTNLAYAILTDCSMYGISAWDVQLEGAVQFNLTITPFDQPIITVDNLKIAQFIYLLLNTKELRDVIHTLTTNSILLLGRFPPERKAVLDAIRDALRQNNYLPIFLDCMKPARRDITESIATLAQLARFVVADLTDAKSILQALKTIVPKLPSVPIQPLILTSQHEYGMFEQFMRYPWVLPVYCYTDEVNLLKLFEENVIAPAEQKVKE